MKSPSPLAGPRGARSQALLALAASCFPVAVSAVTWDNSNATGAWSTAANWNPDGEPTAATPVIFPVGLAGTITLSGAENAASLQFDDAYTLSGGTSLTLPTASSINVANGVTVTIATPLSISGGYSKTGNGVLVLNGANTNTVGTIITAGKIRAGNTGAMGSATAVTTVDSGTTLEIASGIALDRPITLMNGGTLAGLGTATNNGKLTIDAAATAVTLATDGASDVLSVGTAANEVSGGTAATVIGISGPGTVRLGLATDFDGSWNVGPGAKLELGAANALGDTTTSSVTLAGGTLSGRVNSATNFTVSQGNNLILTASSSILSDRSTSSSSTLTHSFGSLNMGTHTLTVSPGTNVTSGTPGIALGNVTLSGDPSFAVVDTAASIKLTTGSLLGGGVARAVSKTGNGDLSVTGGATDLPSGSTFTATGGGTIEMLFANLGATTPVTISSAQNPFGSSSLSITDGSLRLLADGNGTATPQTYVLPMAITLAGSVTLDPDRRTASNVAKTFELPGLSIASGSVISIAGDNAHGLRLAGGLALQGSATLQGSSLSSKDGLLTLDAGILGAVDTQLSIGGGTSPLNLTVNGASTYGGGTLMSGGNVTLNTSNALGSGPVSVSGGTLIVAADDALNGTVSVTGGTLRVMDIDAIDGNAVNLNGGTLDLRSNTNATYVTGTLTVSGNSVLSLGNAGSGTSQILNFPALNVSGTTALTVAPLNSYVINLSAINLAGDLALTQTGTARVQGITESGGPRLFSKAGTGTLEMKAASSHSGGTEVLAGILQVENAGALGSGALTLGASSGTATATATFSSGLAIPNNIIARMGGSGLLTLDSPSGNVTWNGSLDLQRGLTIDNGSGLSTYSGVISGSGGLTKVSAGEIKLANAANTFGNGSTSAVTISAGTLSVSNDGALGNPANGVSTAGSAQLKIDSGFSTSRTITTAGTTNGVTVVPGQELLFNGALAGAGTFSKAGDGIMTLGPAVDSSARGSTAPTRVTAGTLRLQGIKNLSDAGPLSLDGSTAALELLRDANTAFAHPFTADGIGSIFVDRAIGGAGTNGRHSLGALTMAAGTLTVNGANGYGLSFGATSISSNDTLTNNSSAPLILASLTGNPGTSSSVTMFFAGSGDIQISGATSEAAGTGNYRLNKTGTGILRLGASLVDFNSQTTVSNGTLDLNGLSHNPAAVFMGGVASAGGSHIVTGAGGLLDLGGTFTFTATGNPAGASVTGNLGLGAAVRTFTIGESNGAAVDLLIDGPISGGPGAGLIKSGSGVLRLGGVGNTQPGLITCSAGTLELAKSSGDAVGSAGLTVTGGITTLLGPSQINDSAAVAVNGTATTYLDLGNQTETTGGITISQTNGSAYSAIKTGSAGTLVLNGNVTFNNNTNASSTDARDVIITGSGGTTASVDGTLDLGGTLRTIHCATTTVGAREPLANATIETRIINGGIIKTGPRTLVLTNPNNNFAGGIQVQQGSIRPTTAGSLGLGPVTFANGVGVSAGLDLTGAASPMSGDFVIAGAGDFELTYAGAEGTTLEMNGDFTLEKDLNVNVVNGTTGIDQTATLYLSGSISDGSSTFGLVKKGNGVLGLAAGNTYSGGTIIQDGVLRISGDSSLGDSTAPLTIDGGALGFNTINTTPLTRNVVFGPNGGSIRGAYGLNKTFSGNLDWGSSPAVAVYGQGPVVFSGSSSGGTTTSFTLGEPLPFAAKPSNAFGEGTGVTLSLRGSATLPGGNLRIVNGAILDLGNGDFTRPIGTGPGEFTLADFEGGGWGAWGADRHVNIGGNGQVVVWPSPGFLLDEDPLVPGVLAPLLLGSITSTHTLIFDNPIDLNADWSSTVGNYSRNLAIIDGSAAIDARITGDITADFTLPLSQVGIYVTGGDGTVEIAGDLVGPIDFFMDHLGGEVIFSGNNDLEETMILISGEWTFANNQSVGAPYYFYVGSGGVVDVNSLSSPLTIAPFGEMSVEGSILGSVMAPLDFDGNGSISGSLFTGSNSRIFPSYNGTLTIGGNYQQVAGAFIDFEINGLDPEDHYNRMRVTGAVNLAGTAIISDYFNQLELGQSFAFILNDGSDPIIGTFSGRPEGSLMSVGDGLALKFTYLANGDGGAVGNDFGVTVVEDIPGSDRQLGGDAPLVVAPGEEILINYYLTNAGPAFELNPSFTATFPSGLGFLGSIPSPSNVDADSVTINLPTQSPSGTMGVQLRFAAPALPGAVRVQAVYDGSSPDPDGSSPTFTAVTAVLAGRQMPLTSVTRSPIDGDLEATIPTLQDVHYLFEGSLELEGWYPIEDFYGDGQPRTIDTPVDEFEEFFRFRIIPWE